MTEPVNSEGPRPKTGTPEALKEAQLHDLRLQAGYAILRCMVAEDAKWSTVTSQLYAHLYQHAYVHHPWGSPTLTGKLKVRQEDLQASSQRNFERNYVNSVYQEVAKYKELAETYRKTSKIYAGLLMLGLAGAVAVFGYQYFM